VTTDSAAPRCRSARVTIDWYGGVLDVLVDDRDTVDGCPRPYLTEAQVAQLATCSQQNAGHCLVELNFGICVVRTSPGSEQETAHVILPTLDGLYQITVPGWRWRELTTQSGAIVPSQSHATRMAVTA
jgi:hypothetical protein